MYVYLRKQITKHFTQDSSQSFCENSHILNWSNSISSGANLNHEQNQKCLELGAALQTLDWQVSPGSHSNCTLLFFPCYHSFMFAGAQGKTNYQRIYYRQKCEIGKVWIILGIYHIRKIAIVGNDKCYLGNISYCMKNFHYFVEITFVFL